jgi:low temperature requirement protein LtrA
MMTFSYFFAFFGFSFLVSLFIVYINQKIIDPKHSTDRARQGAAVAGGSWR